jgi:hypothetical protein
MALQKECTNSSWPETLQSESQVSFFVFVKINFIPVLTPRLVSIGKDLRFILEFVCIIFYTDNCRKCNHQALYIIFLAKESCSKAIVVPGFGQGIFVRVSTTDKENLTSGQEKRLWFWQTKGRSWREINILCTWATDENVNLSRKTCGRRHEKVNLVLAGEYKTCWLYTRESKRVKGNLLTVYTTHEKVNLLRETCQRKLADRTHEKVNLSRKTCWSYIRESKLDKGNLLTAHTRK